MKAKVCWLFLWYDGPGFAVSSQRTEGGHRYHRNVTYASRRRFVALARRMTTPQCPIRPTENGWCWMDEGGKHGR